MKALRESSSPGISSAGSNEISEHQTRGFSENKHAVRIQQYGSHRLLPALGRSIKERMENVHELEPSTNLTEEQREYWEQQLRFAELKVQYALRMLGTTAMDRDWETYC